MSAKELKQLILEDRDENDLISLKRLRRKILGNELCRIIDDAVDKEEPEVEPPAYAKESFSEEELQNLVSSHTAQRKADVVDSFIGMLTLHGYPQFHTSTGIRKLLWAIVLLIMAGSVLYLAVLSYSPENLYKQIIELETEKVDEIAFPTVTICNYSPVYPPEAYKRFPVNITEAEFLWFYHEIVSNRRGDATGEKPERIAEILRQLRAKGYDGHIDILKLFEKNEERDVNSNFTKQVMKQNRCLYENKPCDFVKDFRVVYRHTSQSLCLQFNHYAEGKKGLVSTGNDIENGFYMFWDISGLHYYYDYGLHGLLMEIHPYGTPHHLIDHRNTIYLEPGSCTNIDIEEIETNRLPPPFKPNCGRRELEIIKNYPYGKSICEADCYLEMIVEVCNCVVDQFAKYTSGEIRTCKVEDMPCVFAASQETHCHDCPEKCHEIQYGVSASRLSIGNNALHDTLKSSPEWRDKSPREAVAYAKQNIVGFRIGFKSLEKQLRNYVEAVPWFERFSLVGGTIGLLMGLSVTTCFEIFFFFVDWTYLTIKDILTHKYLKQILKKETLFELFWRGDAGIRNQLDTRL